MKTERSSMAYLQNEFHRAPDEGDETWGIHEHLYDFAKLIYGL